MTLLTRRSFLHASAALLVMQKCGGLCRGTGSCAHAAGQSDIKGSVFKGGAPRKLWRYAREGAFYTKSYGNKVACDICPNHCILSPGDLGVCRSKVNLGGRLYSITYANPCSANVDPMEKKPLFHFMPGSRVFSIATTGCNIRCLNCQNWEISQSRPEEVRFFELFPSDVVKAVRSSKSRSIAYTYSEPIAFYEYMLDTAELARKAGIANVFISNGYINTGPLLKLCTVLDAANINLKSFSDEVYMKLNGARLDPVLSTLRTLHERRVHLEITNLVVPGYTDDEEMVRRMCGWIVKNVGQDNPLHFLRFFPKYKLDRLPPTPIATLERFRTLAMREGIRYVYVGNIPGHEGNNTYCHDCGKLLIERKGYLMPVCNLKGGACGFCGAAIPGVWS